MKVLLIFFAVLSINISFTQRNGEIRLIVRSDDIGFCHTANQTCMRVYQEGISRSVEIIAPAPWFMEAVRLLQAHPQYDVGVHLCLTSEWENLRWRPLTHAPSLTDTDGYFAQFIWKNKNLESTPYLLQKPLNLVEIEQEFRAQIELVRKYLPHVSHLSAHMGCNQASADVKALVERLAIEYKLPIELPKGAKFVSGFGGSDKSPTQKEQDLVKILRELPAGTHYLVEHPGLDNDEMRAIGHKGYENVGYDRAGVTQAFTSAAVKKVIAERKIRLMSIKEALSW